MPSPPITWLPDDVPVKCPNMCHKGQEPVTAAEGGISRGAFFSYKRCPFCNGKGNAPKRLLDAIDRSI